MDFTHRTQPTVSHSRGTHRTWPPRDVDYVINYVTNYVTNSNCHSGFDFRPHPPYPCSLFPLLHIGNGLRAGLLSAKIFINFSQSLRLTGTNR